MSEERWCQKCWMTRRTSFIEAFQEYICNDCLDFMVRKEIDQMMKDGIITNGK